MGLGGWLGCAVFGFDSHFGSEIFGRLRKKSGAEMAIKVGPLVDFGGLSIMDDDEYCNMEGVSMHVYILHFQDLFFCCLILLLQLFGLCFFFIYCFLEVGFF